MTTTSTSINETATHLKSRIPNFSETRSPLLHERVYHVAGRKATHRGTCWGLVEAEDMQAINQRLS
jgi:hypothetical protein